MPAPTKTSEDPQQSVSTSMASAVLPKGDLLIGDVYNAMVNNIVDIGYVNL